jgi:hypothetical protein
VSTVAPFRLTPRQHRLASSSGARRCWPTSTSTAPTCSLFGFALGVLAGALFRRTVVAMTATLVGFGVVRVLIAELLRPYLLAHLANPSSQYLRGQWIHGQFVNAAGQVVPDDNIFARASSSSATVLQLLPSSRSTWC